MSGPEVKSFTVTCLCGKHQFSPEKEMNSLKSFRSDIIKGVFGTKNRSKMLQTVDKMIEEIR